MTAQIIAERAAQFETMKLLKGKHSAPDMMCAMEAASWLVGEEYSDHPQCVCPIIAACMRRLNDRMNDEDRQMLKPYIARVLNTRADHVTEARRTWIAVDIVIRKIAPLWLDLAGLNAEADALRALARVTAATVGVARALTISVRDKSQAKRLASFGKLRAAAYAAAAYAADAAYAAYAAAAAAAAACAAAADAAADDAAAYAAAAAAADAADAADAAADAAAYAAAYAADAAAYAAPKRLSREEIRKRCEDALAPTVARVKPLLLETIDAMIAVGAE
jgi:hypothetical protein